jgi:hypothetical protein
MQKLLFATVVALMVGGLLILSAFAGTSAGFISGNASVSVSPTIVVPGGTLVVTLNLNSGYMSGQWFAVYLSSSTCGCISPGDIPLALAVNRAQGYTVGVKIPSNIIAGQTYYIKVTDDFKDAISAPISVVSGSSSNIVLNSTSGYVGSQVSMILRNMPANTALNVYWDTTTNQLTSVSTDGLGYGSGVITVPASTMGTHDIIVGTSSQVYAVALFSVEPYVTVTPATGGFAIKSGSAYQNVVISGTGLPAGTISADSMSVTNGGYYPLGAVYNPSETVAATGTNAGVLSGFQATVAPGLPNGVNYYVEFQVAGQSVLSQPFGASQATTTGSFSVTYSPTSGGKGTLVQLYGYGFSSSNSVEISLVMQGTSFSVGTFSTDVNGGLSATFSVPEAPSTIDNQGSSYTLQVVDEGSHVSKDVGSFTVLTAASTTQLTIQPGQTLSVVINGAPYTFNLTPSYYGQAVVYLNNQPVNVTLSSSQTVQTVTGSTVKLGSYGNNIHSGSNGYFPLYAGSPVTLEIQIPKFFTVGQTLTLTIYGESLVTGQFYTLTMQLNAYVG